MSDPFEPVAMEFAAESRRTLAAALAKIEHCLAQLDEADLHWRLIPSHNSVSNIILHLCGNLRQWIASGIGGAPDHRNRPEEFADHSHYSRADLLARLRATVADADRALAGCNVADLAHARRIQGFDVTGVHAIWDSVSHFVGHTHQIVYITRLRVGDRYDFQFVPKTVEQGAPVKRD